MKSILIFTLFSLVSCFSQAVTIAPNRVDAETFAGLRAMSDFGTANLEEYGFVQGRFEDMFYNQVLDCVLEELDQGAVHRLGITQSASGAKVYDYIDVASEGYYKILASGDVSLDIGPGGILAHDASGGSVLFAGPPRKSAIAHVDLKQPALSVSQVISCWREQ